MGQGQGSVWIRMSAASALSSGWMLLSPRPSGCEPKLTSRWLSLAVGLGAVADSRSHASVGESGRSNALSLVRVRVRVSLRVRGKGRGRGKGKG